MALLAAAVFFVRTAALMLGPLLVALAAAFHTSVPVMGQLAAAINLSWGITAPLVGPVSDTSPVLGMVLVVPLIALLVDLGGRRVPFWVMGLMIAVVWGLQ